MIDIDVSKIVSQVGEPTARFIESEESKKQRKSVIVFSIVFLAIFIISPIIFMVLSNASKTSASKVSTKIKQLTDENAKLLDVENLGMTIEKRNRSINLILKSNPNWSFVFGKLEEVVPKGITFASFQADSPTALKIGGVSPDYPTLSTLVVALQQMKYTGTDNKETVVFDNVSLVNASLVTIEERKYVDFVISFALAKNINRQSLNPITAPKQAPTTPPAETTTPAVAPAPAVTPPAETPAPTVAPTPTEGNTLPTL